MLSPLSRIFVAATRVRAPAAVLAVACLLSLIAACTSVETQSYRVQQGANVESAQVATDADFSRYDRLQAEEMGIYFPTDSPVSDEDIFRLRQIFRGAFLDELKAYRIVREPGPTTMTVQASLIDLRQTSGTQLPTLRRDVREIAKSGSLVFLMELRDSETNRVLARAADSASTIEFADAGRQETDWTSVEAAASRWAELFRGFLDRNLGR
jgi:hypothetical protein